MCWVSCAVRTSANVSPRLVYMSRGRGHKVQWLSLRYTGCLSSASGSALRCHQSKAPCCSINRGRAVAIATAARRAEIKSIHSGVAGHRRTTLSRYSICYRYVVGCIRLAGEKHDVQTIRSAAATNVSWSHQTTSHRNVTARCSMCAAGYCYRNS